MLRIRLTRTGKRHEPTYRIVVAEHSAPVKGKFLEIVGYYLPTRKPKVFEVKADRIQYWISQGALASDTVHNLLVDKKVLTEKRNIKYSRVKEEKETAPVKTVTTIAETPADEVLDTGATDQSATPNETTPEVQS